jgi:hypothetical protein
MRRPIRPSQQPLARRDEMAATVIQWLHANPTKTRFTLTRGQLQSLVDLAFRNQPKPKRAT